MEFYFPIKQQILAVYNTLAGVWVGFGLLILIMGHYIYIRTKKFDEMFKKMNKICTCQKS